MGMDQHLIMKDPMKYHSERVTLAIAINQMHRFMNNVGMLNMRLVGRWNLVALDSVLHSEEQDSRLILCRFHGSLTVYSLFILNRLGDDDDDDGDDDDDVDDDVVLKVLPLPRAWPIAVAFACFLLILSQVS